MGDVTYFSKVRIEPVEGKVRRVHLPVQEEPIFFGVHSEVAEHYGVSPEEGVPRHPRLPRRGDRRLTARYFQGRAGSASGFLR